MNKTLAIIGIIVTLTLTLLACSDSLSPNLGSTVYLNSFDRTADFDGWAGITADNWKQDVPSTVSTRSVLISGGCIAPHAEYIFNNQLPPGHYTIECWGKAYDHTPGGFVMLLYEVDGSYSRTTAMLQVHDSTWTYLTSDTLFYDQTSDLRIQMMAGGISYSAMLIDDLVVKKID